ncbi:heterokaryon incompatibility protein-domain-containing protein [Paraphoma chrysanthemicola]|uniref:Heterokaryon incompatibility protein-domain-containing protein n=1 Tax=Paraphoma chrysanthemicola TaxID=798071 RepID=A0A8K0VYT9_9PLEO|nr:heterokaryon incompatibility protein-domain-containing protein [Paraphoma chrysanthemicola]
MREMIVTTKNTLPSSTVTDTMTPIATIPGPADRFFAYDPLDLTKRSIRLIRVLPNVSDEGQIQCELRHASIDTEYICLSYVWGPPDEGYRITINGRVHTIRENLFQFLRVARRKNMKWLWIDALCIDQANNFERNHQVQQMGLIYLSAIGVVAWLGTNEHVAAFLAGMHDSRDDFPLVQVNEFDKLAYWTRAWITQECELARELVLIAGDSETNAEAIPMAVKAKFVDEAIILRHASDLVIGDKATRSRNYRKLSLINLLKLHGQKACENVLDRVFSLLSICCDGHGIVVNYDASNEQVALNVIQTSQKGLRLCWIATVCRALEVESITASAAGNSVNLVLPVLWSSQPFKPLSLHRYITQQPHVHGQRATLPIPPSSILLGLDLAYLCKKARGALFVHIRRRRRLVMYHYSYRLVGYGDSILECDPSSRQSWSTGFSVKFSEDGTVCAITFSLRLLLHLAMMESYTHRSCGEPLDIFRACGDLPEQDGEIKYKWQTQTPRSFFPDS